MILEKILEMCDRVEKSQGVSKDEIYDIDNELDGALLPLLNINEYSRFPVANDVDKLLNTLNKLYALEQSVGDNVEFIVENINKTDDYLIILEDIVKLSEVDDEIIKILEEGGLTGEVLSRTEPWFTTVLNFAETIKGALTLEQQELLDTLIENKDKLPFTIYGNTSIYYQLHNKNKFISVLKDSLDYYRNLVVENPAKPNIYRKDLTWLTQHTNPLNLTVAKFIYSLGMK